MPKLLEGNVRKASDVRVSVDVGDVLNVLDFLKAVNDDGVGRFYQPAFVQNALRRYERCWIPFLMHHSASEADDLKFAAPPGKLANFPVILFTAKSLCWLLRNDLEYKIVPTPIYLQGSIS